MSGVGSAGVVISMLMATGAPSIMEAGDSSDVRRRTLEDTFVAFRAMDEASRTRIFNYIYRIERDKCQAPLRSLKVGCLLEAARRNCRRRGVHQRKECRRVSDVIVANRLSEPRFLTRSDRYQIMKESDNYRDGLSAELRRRYARLVTGLYLKVPVPADAAPETLAAAVDGYCLDIAGQRSRLSWTHCAAAVVWFIGTSPSEASVDKAVGP